MANCRRKSFSATLLKVIVQETMSQRFQPENLLRSAKCYHLIAGEMIVVEKSELERHRSVA